MQETISTVSPNTNKPAKGSKKILGIIIVLIVAAVLAGILIMRKSQKSEKVEVPVTEKKEPTPTEKPQIDKKTVKIQVLNGTGTPGQAGIAVDALKEAGYSSDNIKAANAPDYDHTVTTVSSKEGFEGVADDVKKALESKFDKVEISSTKLGESSEFDIVVTTGGKKFEEATSTPGPTKATSITPSPTSATTTVSPSPSATSTPTPTP